MSLHRIKFKLSNYDAWDDDSDFERTKNAWKQAAQCLSTLRYSTNHGLIDVHVNWEPAIEGLSTHYRVEAEPQATIEVHNKMNKVAAQNISRSYLELFLSDFFLIFNLSVPGACNFYNTEIKSSMPHYRTRINLDSYTIERAISSSKARGWPIIKDIEMASVLNWLQSLKIEVRQVAQSRIERVLFGLLNALHGDTDITSIIWLSQALESFYDTPALEIVRHLRDRAFKWLSLPDNNKKTIKKEFDNFYSIRSSYVHGTLKIIHPLGNEVIDKSVTDQYMNIYDATHFGLSMLIASIQLLIENNYYELSFNEVIQGNSIMDS